MTLQIRGTKPVTAHDITETLRDLPDAIYSSADLYARYRSTHARQGLAWYGMAW